MDTPQQTPDLASESKNLISRIIESADGLHHHGRAEKGVKASSSKNGVKGSFKQGMMMDEYDPNLTRNVISAMGPKTSPRLRQIMTSLIQHLHEFARDVNLTVPEWMAAVEVINESGRMSTSSRNETQLICDILGLESLVDEITSKQLAGSAPIIPTASAILGPFWRASAPLLPMGSSIVHSLPTSCGTTAERAYLHGRVLSASTGLPLANAELDIWHTAPNGLYEQQDPEQVDMNLRGRFVTAEDGRYAIYCLRPTSYPIPYDGPAGRLLQLLDRHPMRPAHIHFIVSAPSHRPLTTQIFDRRDTHIADDAVFAVKESLICDFLPREGDPNAQFQLEYDFRLAGGL